MSKKVLVIENDAAAPLGLVAQWLTANAVEFDVVKGHEAGEIPATLPEEYAGLIVLGGAMGANEDDKHTWLTAERKLLENATAADVPVLGICLGAQMLSTAIGGIAEKSPHNEVGVHTFKVSEAAAGDALFGPLVGQELRASQWHQDWIRDLPETATVLAGNEVCPVQAYRVGEKAYGFQFHPEADFEIFKSWGTDVDEVLAATGLDIHIVNEQVAQAQQEMQETWAPVIARWAKLL
jgi:GMP synthase (glutamine-hydrolysing)